MGPPPRRIGVPGRERSSLQARYSLERTPSANGTRDHSRRRVGYGMCGSGVPYCLGSDAHSGMALDQTVHWNCVLCALAAALAALAASIAIDG